MTLNELTKLHPEYKLVVVMDSDQLRQASEADQFTTWEIRRGREFPKLNRIELELEYEVL